MGKDWDKAVPSVDIWQECLRVLKPGAFCCVMSAPRSDVQNAMISRLLEAGFRLDFTPIYWTYASGFPKAGNIGKMVDKRLGTYVEGEPNKNARFADQPQDGDYNHSKITREFTAQSDQAKALDGSYAGFQPKPAVEVIIVAMKPLSEKTYVDQALKNGKGISWLDDGRIPSTDISGWESTPRQKAVGGMLNYIDDHLSPFEPNTQGRFPANLLVSDDVLNDGVEYKGGSNQSQATGIFGNRMRERQQVKRTSDSGSYSRYFDLDKWAQTLPFLIVPKAAKGEKNHGLHHLEEVTVGDGRSIPADNAFQRGKTMRKNSHPTVKPLKLMSYLITLFTRKGDIVLDPFCGSGTTNVAAYQLERETIGIEREAEYVEIAKARLANNQYQRSLL